MAAGYAVLCIGFVALVNICLFLFNANNPITKRFFQWRSSFFATNRGTANVVSAYQSETKAEGSSSNQYPGTFFAFDVLDPAHAVTGLVRPLGLLLLRILQLVVFLFTVIFEHEGPEDFATRGRQWLKWFTSWTFVGFGLSSLLGIFLSTRAICCCSASLTVFYWISVYEGGRVTVDNPIKHGGSAGLLLAEVVASRIPIVSWHLMIVINYISTYAVFMWVWKGASGEWLYSALNFNKPTGIVWYVALMVLLLIIYCLMFLLAWLRELVIRRTGSNGGIVQPQIQRDVETAMAR